MDPINFSDSIFSTEIKSPHTIQLELEDMDIGDLFEFLLLVFTNGLKHFYSKQDGKVDLTTVSPEQFNKINEYYHSFGFECVYVIYPVAAESEINFNKLSYKNKVITSTTHLSCLCYPMKVRDRIYVIGFDFYKNLN